MPYVSIVNSVKRRTHPHSQIPVVYVVMNVNVIFVYRRAGMNSQYRCETCKHHDKFFSSCKLLFYDTHLGGKKETIHPVIGHKDDWMITTLGCASHSDFQSEREKAIYSLEYHLPKQIPSIKKRQLAYKDFEENGESWCSLPDSPMLEDGDIIQIIRQEGKVEK